MPQIVKVYPHHLQRDDAVTRIKKMIEQEKIDKANIVTASTDKWVTDYELVYSMKIFGYDIDGDLFVEDSSVRIKLNLPVIAIMVRGMIESQLDAEMNKLLS